MILKDCRISLFKNQSWANLGTTNSGKFFENIVTNFANIFMISFHKSIPLAEKDLLIANMSYLAERLPKEVRKKQDVHKSKTLNLKSKIKTWYSHKTAVNSIQSIIRIV